MAASDKKNILDALEANWQAEMDGFHSYTALSNREADPHRRNALRGLAMAEKHHADLWTRRIKELGGKEPQFRGNPNGQADSLANRVGGAELAFRRLEIDEGRDIAKYGKQIKELGDEPSIAILEEAIADEREHYLTLANLIRARGALPALPPEQAQAALDELVTAREKGHSQAAGWVGDAIYGINDGLGSIFGIVSGVSGASLGNSHFVLIAGLAGMVASALSMGSGAYLAAKSEREIYEAEFAREREAVEDNEAEAREVLSLSYQIRGLPEEDAERFVEHLANDKNQLIKALARERLNTTEEGLSKPLVMADSVTIDPQTGERITSASSPQIDPATGERITAASVQAPTEGFWHSLGAQFGLTPEAAKAAAQDAKDHPIKDAIWGALGPAGQVAKGLYEQAKQSGGEAGQAYQAAKEGNAAGVAYHGVKAIPIVGPALDKAADQYAGKNYAGEAGTLVGASAQAAPMVAGAADAALPDRPTIPNPPSPAAVKAKLYPTSQSLAEDASTARNLAKSLVVDPAGVNNFVKAATDEAGTVVGYAKDNGLPINSKVDFANAAKQTADAVQAHYNDNILAPNANKVVSVPTNYRGTPSGTVRQPLPTATLGDINARIDAINQELNPNFRKGLASQTNAANVSDADLTAEKRALTTILHDKLADATGLSSEDIAAVRQQAGKLRTIADESMLSANRDLTAAGRQDAGGTTPSSIGTKQGMLDKAWQWAQGGSEVIGNRQILQALQKVQPKPLDLPQPTGAAAPGGAGAAYELWKSIMGK